MGRLIALERGFADHQPRCGHHALNQFLIIKLKRHLSSAKEEHRPYRSMDSKLTMENLLRLLEFMEEYTDRVLPVALLLLAAEVIFPKSRYSYVSKLRGMIFCVTNILITKASLTLFYWFWAGIGVKPLFAIDLTFLSRFSNAWPLHLLGAIAASFLVLQVSEFFYYWFHRLQHSNRFFWRFHAEHHSLEEMSAFNSNHHFSEEIFRIPFLIIPVSLLFDFKQDYVPWIWVFFVRWQGYFEHSSTRLNLGWVRYIFPDNRFHRIHHSIERRHFNRNFGSGSAIWDILFGTAYYPKAQEWPDVGLPNIREPQNLTEFLIRPFRRGRHS